MSSRLTDWDEIPTIGELVGGDFCRPVHFG